MRCKCTCSVSAAECTHTCGVLHIHGIHALTHTKSTSTTYTQTHTHTLAAIAYEHPRALSHSCSFSRYGGLRGGAAHDDPVQPQAVCGLAVAGKSTAADVCAGNYPFWIC
jgi:hypothetical protein